MRRRAIRFLLVTAAAPLAGRAAVAAARRLEETKGQTAVSSGLRRGGTMLAGRRAGR